MIVQYYLNVAIGILIAASAAQAAPSNIEDRSAGAEAQTTTVCLDPQLLAINDQNLRKMARSEKVEGAKVIQVQMDAIPKAANHLYVDCSRK